MPPISTYLDPQSGKLTQPILVTAHDTCVYGVGEENHWGQAVYFTAEGPCVAVVPEPGSWYPYPVLQVDQKQNSWLMMDGGLDTVFELSDSPSWDINGVNTVGIECWINATALPAETRYLVYVGGREFATPDSPITSAMSLTSVSGYPTFSVTTTVGTFSLQVPKQALTIGTPVHIKGAYEGGALWIYVNGQVACTLPGVSGAVVMQPWETALLGYYATDPGGGNAAMGGLPGMIRNLRMYDQPVRPIGQPFDPNVWLGVNLQKDRFWMDCASTYGPFVKYIARTGNPGFLMLRSSAYGLTGQAGCEVKNITFNGVASKTAVMGVGAVGLRLTKVCCMGGRYGAYLSNNCYNSYIDDCRFWSGPYGRAGVYAIHASSPDCTKLDTRGQPYGCITDGMSVSLMDIIPSRCGFWLSEPGGTALFLSGGMVYTETAPNIEAIAIANPHEMSWDKAAYGVGRSPIRIRGTYDPKKIWLGPLEGRQPAGVPVCDGAPDVDVSRINVVN
jgi:hypothetical protein